MTQDLSEIETVVQMLKSRPLAGDLQQVRQQFEEQAAPMAEDIKSERVDANGVFCEILTPPGADTDRIIHYVHGGGYVIGSLNTHRATVGELARAAGCRALVVDYRLAPEHPFPAAVEDSVTAYQWLLANGYRPERIAIAGDSAGGGLTVATLVALRDRNIALPAAAVPISPWADLTMSGESYQTRKESDPMVTDEVLKMMSGLYIGGQDAKTPLASPLYADLKGLPPLLIQVGEREVLFSDAESLAKRAEAAGVDVTFEEWKDMVHVWHMFFPILQEGRRAIQRAGAFIRQHTAVKAAA
jgi:acetyl esterase/lipase